MRLHLFFHEAVQNAALQRTRLYQCIFTFGGVIVVVALYLFFIFQIGCPGFLTRDVFLLPFSSFKEREREREVAFFLLSLSSFFF